MRRSLLHMVADHYPGARLVSTRRLPGGLAAQTHAARIELASGARTTLVVRRKANGAWRIPRHFRTLEVLAESNVPAPTPVLLDVNGQYFDVPTMIIEHAGYPLLRPQGQGTWVEQMARALHKVHGVTPENADLAYLLEPPPGVAPDPPGRGEPDPLIERVRAAMRRFEGEFYPLPPTLVHDDFWPGNTVWLRQQLTAVIDWDGAKVGDRRIDVAQCRLDLTFVAGEQAAADFLRDYEALHGGPLHDLWYFDLACFERGHGWFERWHDGYADIGINWTSPEEMVAAGREFAARALAAAPR